MSDQPGRMLLEVQLSIAHLMSQKNSLLKATSWLDQQNQQLQSELVECREQLESRSSCLKKTKTALQDSKRDIGDLVKELVLTHEIIGKLEDKIQKAEEEEKCDCFKKSNWHGVKSQKEPKCINEDDRERILATEIQALEAEVQRITEENTKMKIDFKAQLMEKDVQNEEFRSEIEKLSALCDAMTLKS